MNSRIQVILLTALAVMLLMTVIPPVVAVSYDQSGETVKAKAVIRYEFLFTESSARIYYDRLFSQYLIVLILTMVFVLTQRAKVPLASRVAKLTLINDKLLEQITDSKYEEQQLRRQMNERVGELNIANEQIKQHIARRRQLEERLERQSHELKTAGERLGQQMAKLEETKEYLNKQAAELAIVKEQLGQQIRERDDTERELRECNEQIEQSDLSSEMSFSNEAPGREVSGDRQQIKEVEHPKRTLKLVSVRLQEKIEDGQDAEMDELLEQKLKIVEPLDAKKLKDLADFAKRLS